MTDYSELTDSISAASEGVRWETSILANASALIYEAMDRLNWCGFYIFRGGLLMLGPFQGKVACVEIELGKGVCGTAAVRDETVLVKDVHTFSGHIACDSASNSEIVIPLHKNGALWGVLDIDSPVLRRFTEADQAGLEAFAAILEQMLSRM